MIFYALFLRILLFRRPPYSYNTLYFPYLRASVTYGVIAKYLLMLTELTQTAIAVLCDICAGSHPYRTAQLHIDPEYLIGILTKGLSLTFTANIFGIWS